MKDCRLRRALRKFDPVHSALQKAESDQQIVTTNLNNERQSTEKGPADI